MLLILPIFSLLTYNLILINTEAIDCKWAGWSSCTIFKETHRERKIKKREKWGGKACSGHDEEDCGKYHIISISLYCLHIL